MRFCGREHKKLSLQKVVRRVSRTSPDEAVGFGEGLHDENAARAQRAHVVLEMRSMKVVRDDDRIERFVRVGPGFLFEVAALERDARSARKRLDCVQIDVDGRDTRPAECEIGRVAPFAAGNVQHMRTARQQPRKTHHPGRRTHHRVAMTE